VTHKESLLIKSFPEIVKITVAGKQIQKQGTKEVIKSKFFSYALFLIKTNKTKSN